MDWMGPMPHVVCQTIFSKEENYFSFLFIGIINTLEMLEMWLTSTGAGFTGKILFELLWTSAVNSSNSKNCSTIIVWNCTGAGFSQLCMYTKYVEKTVPNKLLKSSSLKTVFRRIPVSSEINRGFHFHSNSSEFNLQSTSPKWLKPAPKRSMNEKPLEEHSDRT